MAKPFVREFSIPLAHPPARLWPLLGNTQRVNELAGNPRYDAREVLHEDGHVDVFGRLRLGPITVEWQEPPVNWIENRWFEQTRRFDNGPLWELRARMELVADGAQATAHYRLCAIPKNLLGRLVAAKAFSSYEKGVRALVTKANERLSANEPMVFEIEPDLAPAARARAQQLAERIEATPYGHGLSGKLVHCLLTGQEIDMWSLRPLALARQWGAQERLVVELFLQAVKEGLLESRWDLLCPRCRVSKEPVTELKDLPKGAHCSSCNIDFGSDFASNVELAFSPGRAIRPIAYGFYCRSGPGGTPHIKGQITLEPGEQQSIPVELAPGAYRLRTLEPGGEVEIEWHGGEFPAICVADSDVSSNAPSAPGTIQISNTGSSRRTVIIEDRSWLREVLTAQRVTTVQAFRDLFSEQVLRPGDDVAIGNITFMFTDLAGSTALYERVGDARAYHVVREHFALLGPIVREHDGTIVKTTGDGIHACFQAPDDALRAAIAMQRAVAEASASRTAMGTGTGIGTSTGDGFAIRIGLHTGSSISVTLNNRLDYYGTTVNTAARLEGQGVGGQITMSEAFVNDVAVRPILEQFEVSERTAELKGLPDPVPIFQITV